MRTILLFLLLSLAVHFHIHAQENAAPTDYLEVIGTDADDDPTNNPETYPKYKGGMEGLMTDIYRSISYPEEAQKQGIEGSVIVKFIVNKAGKVKHVKIFRGLTRSINKTVQKGLRDLGIWIPGTSGGEPVNVVYHLPVRFSLE